MERVSPHPTAILARRAGRAVLRHRAELFAQREARDNLWVAGFSIISDDCWGGELYRLTDKPFSTPFIGVAIRAPSYMNILRNLPAALLSPLVQLETSRYADAERERQAFPKGPFPVGLLTDVDAEISFMHYAAWSDAHAKWMRRRERVNLLDPLIKIGTHRGQPDSADAGTLAEFARLPFARKLVVSDRPVASLNTALAPYHYDAVVRLHAGASRFDHVDWLNGGDGQPSPVQRASRALRFGGWH